MKITPWAAWEEITSLRVVTLVSYFINDHGDLLPADSFLSATGAYVRVVQESSSALLLFLKEEGARTFLRPLPFSRPSLYANQLNANRTRRCGRFAVGGDEATCVGV